jgi:tryptophan halogenase
MLQNLLVLGAGSAGLLTAIALKVKIPKLTVRVVRSPEIGVIGVGEGTTPNFPRFLFEYLGISRKRFYELAQPTWKLGIRFVWGPRDHFHYSFSKQLDTQWNDLPRPTGYYCDEEFGPCDLASALMAENKVFAQQVNGGGAPDVQPWHAFHIENAKFVEVLELLVRQLGIEIIDGKVTGVDRGPQGVERLHLEDGRQLNADLYIDASGFRSELLGRAFAEPFVSYSPALFCDRAVIGGWDRTTEPILPYTIAETMDSGWSWQIEHEHHINRGYVYSSQFISDEEAAEEFLRKNPKAPKSPRVVKFRSGRYQRQWVDNVVAVGNAGGFVEPLEATALMIVCSEVQTLIDMLLNCNLRPTPTLRDLFNDLMAGSWDDIRDFLALHYYVNSRVDTPFWRHCRNDTDISTLEPLLEFYKENGPSGFARYLLRKSENDFGMEGYLVMLVGNQVPYSAKHEVSPLERQIWSNRQLGFQQQARSGLTVREALAFVQHPGWQWHGDAVAARSGAA